MNKNNENARPVNPTRISLAGFLIAIFLFAAYVYLYQLTPLTAPWNDVALNGVVSFAAMLTAVIATVIYFHYHPDDLPRKVWFNLMLGVWFWFLGDTLWGVFAYYSESGEVSTPSLADAAWIVGIALFTFAFYNQYVIVFPAQKRRILNVAVGAWIFSALLPAAVLLFSGSFEWSAYVDYYYPSAEILIGIAGIALVVAFQGGALVRPWIGMVIFSISDFFYAWAEQFGFYEWSSANNNMLTLAIDTSYLAAYLMLAFGFLGHWILINYGLRSKR